MKKKNAKAAAQVAALIDGLARRADAAQADCVTYKNFVQLQALEIENLKAELKILQLQLQLKGGV